ncbi:MAG TPA: tetratricopeptide repeat protein, partial [Terriglobales bacterium]|nr:tetratricopeptide repeat protein [Terriglobales bacterium]
MNTNGRIPLLPLVFSSVLLLVVGQAQVKSSTQETWKATEDAAASASKRAQFAAAEKLLVANQRLSETFSAKDARLPLTLFDLAQVYRAEGKYSDALPLYERALEIYTRLYGHESPEFADVLNGEAELYKSLNDYAQAEQLLVRALAIRQRLLPLDSADVAESKNDLGEVYTAIGAFDKAEPLLLEALAIRKKKDAENADVAQSLVGLGLLNQQTGRAQQAETL